MSRSRGSPSRINRPLLNGMRHFVRHQTQIGGRLAGAEPDMVPVGKCAGPHSLAGRLGAAAGVHPHITQIDAQPALKRVAGLRRQGFSGTAGMDGLGGDLALFTSPRRGGLLFLNGRFVSRFLGGFRSGIPSGVLCGFLCRIFGFLPRRLLYGFLCRTIARRFRACAAALRGLLDGGWRCATSLPLLLRFPLYRRLGVFRRPAGRFGLRLGRGTGTTGAFRPTAPRPTGTRCITAGLLGRLFGRRHLLRTGGNTATGHARGCRRRGLGIRATALTRGCPLPAGCLGSGTASAAGSAARTTGCGFTTLSPGCLTFRIATASATVEVTAACCRLRFRSWRFSCRFTGIVFFTATFTVRIRAALGATGWGTFRGSRAGSLAAFLTRIGSLVCTAGISCSFGWFILGLN